MRVQQGDCRLLDLGGPHDLCIADPPYADTSLVWDRICHGWLPAAARALKPNASLWMFGSMRHFASQRIFAQMRAHGFRYSQDIVWEKQNGTGFHADRFRRVHEHAVLFYRGAWGDVYHQPQTFSDPSHRAMRVKKRAAKAGEFHHGTRREDVYESEEGGSRLERTVQRIRNEHGRAIHPTQKPEDLLRVLLRYSTPPGGSVLDIFGGSAATGAAARAEGLDCLCVEIDPEMVSKSRERLAGGPLFATLAELHTEARAETNSEGST